MIHPDEAKKILDENIFITQSEEIYIEDATGRILYNEIISEIDSPPFDKSAMDGFAYNSKDEGKPLKIKGIIAAGDTKKYFIDKGECLEIMTGAKIPENANKVIPIENVEIKNGFIFFNPSSNDNIIKKGENLKTGDLVLPKILLKAQHIGILASLGYRKIKVHKVPKVGIITTGTEIVEPGKILKNGQIFNSNAYQLIAQLKNISIKPIYYGTVADEENQIENIILKSTTENDITILSGGVSMGKFDFIPKTLEKIGFNILFHKIAIKPGKPTLFAKNIHNKIVFGLPGNPVSTFVIFEFIIKPFIYKTMNYEYSNPIIKAELTKNLKRKKTVRFEYIPVIVENGKIYPIKYHGSSHLNVLALANGFIRYEKGQAELKKGSILDVRQI